MVIRTNIAALQLQRNWQEHTTLVGKAIERLSSGFKINRAADNASGLAISKKTQMRLALLREEQLGAMNSISSHEIADSALDQMQQLLRRMGELAGRSANGTMDGFDRLNLGKEYQQLLEELDRMSPQTAVGANLFSVQHPASAAQETLVFQGNNLDALLDGLNSFLDSVSSAARDDDKITLASLGIRLEDGVPDKTSLREATAEFIKENAAKLLESPKASGNIDSFRYNVSISDRAVYIEAQGWIPTGWALPGPISGTPTAPGRLWTLCAPRRGSCPAARGRWAPP